MKKPDINKRTLKNRAKEKTIIKKSDYFAIALNQYNKKNYSQALVSFRKAITKQPNSYKPLLYEINTLYRLKQFTKIKGKVKNFIKKFPQHKNASVDYANTVSVKMEELGKYPIPDLIWDTSLFPVTKLTLTKATFSLSGNYNAYENWSLFYENISKETPNRTKIEIQKDRSFAFSMNMNPDGTNFRVLSIHSAGDIEEATNKLSLRFNSRKVAKKRYQIFSENEFLFYLDALWYNTEKYLNEDIEIKGMYYYDDKQFGQYAIISRYIVTCCIPDSVLGGYSLKFSKNPNIENGQWLLAKGKLIIAEDGTNDILALKVNKYQQIETPKQPYVYPKLPGMDDDE